MTDAALRALLAAYVNAGFLTLPDAQALLAAWTAGTITDADLPADLFTGPVAVATLTSALSAVSRRIATAYALTRGATFAGDGAAAEAVLRAVDRLPLSQRLRILDATRADDVRGALSREAERATRVLFADRDVATFGPGQPGSARQSAGSVSRWQTRFRAAYAEDAATLARLGAGGDLTAAQAARLARVVASRGTYVDGFAARLTQAAAGTAAPLSERQIVAALVRQSGEARALFFENAVERETGTDAGAFEVWYEALDTPSTCSACLDAQAGSPYPADGPFPIPGRECYGGGHCKCSLRIEPIAARVAA